MNIKKILFICYLVTCFGIHSEAFTKGTIEEYPIDVPSLDRPETKSGIDNLLTHEFTYAISSRNFSSGITERTKNNPIDLFGFHYDNIFYPHRYPIFDLAYLKIAKSIFISFPNFLIAFPHYYFT